MSPKKQDNLSPAVHTAIGGLAGIIEVCIMQPTVAVKNALQEGRPLPANPAAYYRGLLVCLPALSCLQVVLSGAISLRNIAMERLTQKDMFSKDCLLSVVVCLLQGLYHPSADNLD